MNKSELLRLMLKAAEHHLKISLIRQLAPYIGDDDVLDALCWEAIATNSHRVREVLIQTLKDNHREANRRFSQIATSAENATHRRWALVNLSLMECRYAREAVIEGLKDTDRSVRFAAALNAGLYHDRDVVNALDRFFESNRLLLIIESIKPTVKSLWPLMKGELSWTSKIIAREWKLK